MKDKWTMSSWKAGQEQWSDSVWHTKGHLRKNGTFIIKTIYQADFCRMATNV